MNGCLRTSAAVPAASRGRAAAEPATSSEGRRWLVFFGEDWGRHNSTGQYLALAMAAARGDRLLWVNSLGLRQPGFNRADLGRAWSRLAAVLRGGSGRQPTNAAAGPPVPAGVTLHVAAPLALPFPRYRWVRRLNRLLVGWQLRRLQRLHGIAAPLVVSACPATADVMDVLGPSATLYYCADEHAALPGMDPEVVGQLERDLLARVDAVLATSRALVERKRQHHRCVRYLPHAVDCTHFASAVRGELVVPADLASLPAPRIGYVGLIGRHLDLDAVARTAAANPLASVVLIGPIESGLQGLPEAANIHYLGPRAYAVLPAYLQGFDVGLLPWSDSSRNRYAHPTKVREYLAAGLSVVASRHPEITDLSRHVHMATDAADFALQVAAQVAVPRRRADRATIAADLADDGWDARARTVQQVLAEVD